MSGPAQLSESKIALVEDAAVGSFCSNAPVVHYAGTTAYTLANKTQNAPVCNVGTTAYTTSGPAQLSADGVIHRSLQAMRNGRLPMNPTPETKEEITPSMPLTAGVSNGGGAASVLSSGAVGGAHGAHALLSAGGRAGTCASSYCYICEEEPFEGVIYCQYVCPYCAMCSHTSTYVLILLYVSSEEPFGGVTNASQFSALLPEDFPSSVLDAGWG